MWSELPEHMYDQMIKALAEDQHGMGFWEKSQKNRRKRS
jgi:hypothetical protein